MKQRALAFSLFIVLAICGAAADEILTADQYFSQVSDRYAQVSDYEAHLVIAAGKSGTMENGLIPLSPET